MAYSSGTAVIVGDLIVNGVIEERINKKDRVFLVLQCQIWNIEK